LIGPAQRIVPVPDELGEEGFFLKATGQDIFIVAREGRGMIYGVGKLLHTAEYLDGSMFASPAEGIERPVMPDRFLYIPPHLHNFYQEEAAEATEPIIEEAALWGINGLVIWLDEASFNDVFDDRVENVEGRRQWAKMKQWLLFGKTLGLKPGMNLSVNDAYKNQLTPEIIGKAGAAWNGEKLVNPTLLAGRALLLRNATNLYRDLADSGIRLDEVLIFFYDPGGCFDEACKPWVITALEVSEELAAALQRYQPGARAYVTDWFCYTEGEGEMMTDYFNRQKNTALAGVWKQDRTPFSRFANLDKRFRLLTFVDVTNLGGWGVIGAQPLPTMITYYLRDGLKNGVTGLMIYSEGIYDDFNKAFAAQVAWDPSTTAQEIARQYANYFWGNSIGEEFWEIVRRSEKGWVDPRIAWQKHQFIDVPVLAEDLERSTLLLAARLSPETRASWRWQVFEYRARIGRIAANLRTAAEFRADILRARDAGVPADSLRREVKEKEEGLARYQALVTELRERVYREPATRFPSMKIEDGWMTQVIQVPAAQWRDVFKELNTKLAANAH
jgi:hypothetical protein